MFSRNSIGRTQFDRASDISDFVRIARNVKHVNINIIIIVIKAMGADWKAISCVNLRPCLPAL
jgi:hypothetical protein